MAKDSSFDVVSEVDRQEVDNALNQARKEIQNRYDFKGTDAEINWSGDLGIEITINQGIADEKAREIVKYVKQANIKGLQVAIQGDQLRVSGKSRDSLQEAIQLLKEKDFGIPLQFTNYR